MKTFAPASIEHQWLSLFAALNRPSSANAAHELKRTNRDKRNAVMVLLKDPEWSGRADGPRFDEPVTDCFAPEIAVNLETGKALMLTVGESGGCRSAAGSRFPV